MHVPLPIVPIKVVFLCCPLSSPGVCSLQNVNRAGDKKKDAKKPGDKKDGKAKPGAEGEPKKAKKKRKDLTASAISYI